MQDVTNRQPDDDVSLSGWVYADLLLALSVVALGAGSFLVVARNVPSEQSSVPQTTTIPTTTTPPLQTANLSCDEFVFQFSESQLRQNPVDFGSRFEQRFQSHAVANQLKDAKVGIMLLFGGYEAGREKTAAGKSRADELLPTLRGTSKLLESVETRTGGADSVNEGSRKINVGGRGSYAIVVYVVYDGDPAASGC